LADKPGHVGCPGFHHLRVGRQPCPARTGLTRQILRLRLPGAELEEPPHLAAGIDPGMCQQSLFRHELFPPDYLHHTNRPDLIDRSLTALNLCQLPASLLMLALAGKLTRRSGSYVVCGVLLLLSLMASGSRRANGLSWSQVSSFRRGNHADPHSCTPTASERAARCAPGFRRDIYNQLLLRGGDPDCERSCVGHHQGARFGVSAHRIVCPRHDRPFPRPSP